MIKLLTAGQVSESPSGVKYNEKTAVTKCTLLLSITSRIKRSWEQSHQTQLEKHKIQHSQSGFDQFTTQDYDFEDGFKGYLPYRISEEAQHTRQESQRHCQVDNITLGTVVDSSQQG